MESLSNSENTKIYDQEAKILSTYSDYSVQEVKSNIKTNQNHLLSMHDMAFVASLAESCIVLPGVVKFTKSGADNISSKEKFLQDRIFSADHFKENIKASHKLESKCNARRKLFEHIREVYPDFANHMDDKISDSDSKTYHTVLRKFRYTLSKELIYTGDTSSSDLLLQKKDDISEVIDSIDFTRASEIEDKFMISELDTFFKMLEASPKEVQHDFKKHNIQIAGGKKQSIFELAEKAKQDRLRRLEKYSSIYNIYKKLEKHPYIKLELENPPHVDDAR